LEYKLYPKQTRNKTGCNHSGFRLKTEDWSISNNS